MVQEGRGVMRGARGNGRIYPRGEVLWVAYHLRGKKIRESTGASVGDEKAAEKFLRNRLKEVHADELGARTFTTPKARRLTVHDLLEALKADLQLRGKFSPQNASHLKRADADFGSRLAVALTAEQIDVYKIARIAKGDAPASINRPLQLIRQAYGFAVKRDHISRVPNIEFLSEKGNARKGFCDEPTFRKILGFLPSYLKDFCLFGYCTGMRYGEIRSLEWAYVSGDVIELQAEDAKGDRDESNARLIPMVGKDLAGILKRRKIARKVKTDDGTTLAALIFHHDGNPIVDIRKAWKTACKKAGVPGLLFHDLRRSAVKNLDEAGVSRDVAKSISGHKTDAMYTRYNITDVKRKRRALELVQEFREAQASEAAQESNVVAMRK
jgi:integrase